MQPVVNGTSRTVSASRRIRYVLVGALLFAVCLGVVLATGVMSGTASVPLANAAVCQAAQAACGGGDGTRTSSAIVQHVYDPQSTNQAVEPNTGESWNITVYWNQAPGGSCAEASETASVDVDWNSTSDTWVLSNTSLTTNIVGITVCTVASLSCSSVSDAHSYGYKLIVDINDPIQPGIVPLNLRQAVYTTTAVDDGNLVNLGPCTLGASQTVNSQTWTVTDIGSAGTGGWECGFNCNATGPTVTIEY